MSPSLKRIFLIGPAILVVVIVLLPLLRPLFQSSEQREAVKQYRKHRAAVQSAWNEASFREVKSSEAFDRAVGVSIRSQPSIASLNERQKASLIVGVKKCIRAYSRLDWDQFSTFRLPLEERDTVFNSQYLARYRQALPSQAEFEKGLESPPPGASDYPEEKPQSPFYDTRTSWSTFRTYWGIFVRYAYNMDSRKPQFCCWKAIALDQLQVSIEEISAGPSPRSLNFQASTNAVPTTFTMASSVRYRPSLEELLEKGRDVTCATISFLVRDSHNPNSYPIHLGLYWHPSHNLWLPFALQTVGDSRIGMKYFF